jgi:hypothetical protein
MGTLDHPGGDELITSKPLSFTEAKWRLFQQGL